MAQNLNTKQQLQRFEALGKTLAAAEDAGDRKRIDGLHRQIAKLAKGVTVPQDDAVIREAEKLESLAAKKRAEAKVQELIPDTAEASPEELLEAAAALRTTDT
ncbi:MAG: hypothetical protein KGZ65_00040 [Sphingomonadales bacterium]|nr:hypothetical protein [Sphingomonadaceae bacterium]MBS3929595.1 hypothetical protein [Sphingomonadales bacterium]